MFSHDAFGLGNHGRKPLFTTRTGQAGHHKSAPNSKNASPANGLHGILRLL